MKLGRWAGLGQGSLLDSMTPVLPSSTPYTPCLPHSSSIPHPILSTLPRRRPLLSPELEVSGNPLAHTGEDPGAWQNPDFSGSQREKGQDLGEGQGWPEGRKLQGEFQRLVESSQAPTCPVFLIPPPAWNVPDLSKLPSKS